MRPRIRRATNCRSLRRKLLQGQALLEALRWPIGRCGAGAPPSLVFGRHTANCTRTTPLWLYEPRGCMQWGLLRNGASWGWAEDPPPKPRGRDRHVVSAGLSLLSITTTACLTSCQSLEREGRLLVIVRRVWSLLGAGFGLAEGAREGGDR
mmetsp:Transcript_60529/g.100080  ORF Transcript_60529/g.100080 Transcript_60529/m.100080 type:complete len:151 (-) Transcript_60529:904-1356(-)